MTKMKIARDLFLRCLSSVYLFAFASLYVQIPGQISYRKCVMLRFGSIGSGRLGLGLEGS